MTLSATDMQTELRSKLSDCLIRLEILEQNSAATKEKLNALTLTLGKMNINQQPQIPALFKPKE